MPLVEPMYWADPNNPQAYEVPDEFRFGTQLVVAPIVTDDDDSASLGRTEAWLPQGEWYDFFDGRRYASSNPSGRRLEVWRAIDRIPVFARAGGIVPLQELGDGDAVNNLDNPQSLRVLVFPGADGRFAMIEDDGVFVPSVLSAPSAQSAPVGESGEHTATTRMAFNWSDTSRMVSGDGCSSLFTIAPVEGRADAVPSRRDWTIVFRGVADVNPADISVNIDNTVCDRVEISYDAPTLSLSITVPQVPSSAGVTMAIKGGLRIADNPIESDALKVLMRAHMPYSSKEHAMQTIYEQGVRAIGALRTFTTAPAFGGGLFAANGMPDAVIGALTEILLRD